MKLLDEIQAVKQRHETERPVWKDKYTIMEIERNAMQNELSEMKSEREALNREFEDVTADNAYFQATCNELKEGIAKMEKNRDVVTAENEQVQKKIGDLQSQTEELRKSTANLSTINKTQLKDTSTLKAKVKQLEESLAESVLTMEKNKKQAAKQVARAPLVISDKVVDGDASVASHSVMCDFESLTEDLLFILYDFNFRANRNICRRQSLKVAASRVVKNRLRQVTLDRKLVQASAPPTLLVKNEWLRDSKEYIRPMCR